MWRLHLLESRVVYDTASLLEPEKLLLPTATSVKVEASATTTSGEAARESTWKAAALVSLLLCPRIIRIVASIIPRP